MSSPSRSWIVALAIALACAAAPACTGDLDAGAGVEEVPGDEGTDPLDAFFSLDGVHDVVVDLADGSYERLLDEPYEYVDAALSLDGTRFERVGVRLKGHAGSFVPIDADDGDDPERAPKPAFLVDLDRYVDGQRYRGLEKFALNNLVQDPGGIHEFVGYTLFRAGGAPAPRTGYAALTVDGEPRGLYAVIEAVDNAVFLDRWFGTDEGTLYEGEYGVDLTADALEEFEQDHGDDETREDLEALVEALDAIGDDDDPLAVLEAHLDLDAYVVFATTELVLGHWDGYAWSVNNYRIHHHPERGDWTFVPWGLDQTFEELPYAGVMQGPGPAWEAGGRVHALCLRSAACRARLGAAFEQTLARIDAVDLAGVAVDAWSLVEQPVLDDAERWGDPAWSVEVVEHTFAYLEQRRGAVEAWLPCLMGGEIDGDGDGSDACTADCDDRDADVHPGADEPCNFVDDDCNGVIDDPDDCPRCQDWTGPDGIDYALCLEWLPWEEAELYCQARGQQLASIHDMETWEQLSWGFVELADVWLAWIGLATLDGAGEFVWTDGTPLDLTLWAEDDAWAWGDCVASTAWGWYAWECAEPMPFICGGG